MTASSTLLRQGRKTELWQKHCGYVNISKAEFMEIQKRLMLEQLALLGSSPIGKSLLGENPPQTIDEFREQTSFTTYADYADLLDDKNESILPVEPYVWARTSGRTSNKPKWVPYPKEVYDRLGDAVIGSMLMSSCSHPGDVKLQLNDKFLLATAPPPYTSGYISHSTQDQLDVIFLPSLEEGEQMAYGERIALGFKLAMQEGLDYFMGLASVLARMGEQFEQDSGGGTKPSKDLLNPFVLIRLLRALLVSKIQKRSILPKDIWKLKGIMSGGTDTDIYRDKIEYYWGFKPLEGYACTEVGNMAMQSWNFRGMTFFPDCAFLEFIPMEEIEKEQKDPNHTPKTVLYDELEIGVYEMVFSNFHGGVFVRYRIGDFFNVIATEDKEINSTLPQLQFYSRVNDLIDIGNFVRLTERDVWRAIEEIDFPYNDWIARKEVGHTHPQIHIYIEPKNNGYHPVEEIKTKLDTVLSNANPEYVDLKKAFDYDPLKLTLLPIGAFSNYIQAQIAAGADLAHIKPPHMQPADHIMERLISTKD